PRRADLRASLPPAVLPAGHARREELVEGGPRAHAALRRLHPDPVARLDPPFSRRRRMQLDLRVALAPAKTRQAAMLRLAELGGLGAGQHEGEARGEVGARLR